MVVVGDVLVAVVVVHWKAVVVRVGIVEVGFADVAGVVRVVVLVVVVVGSDCCCDDVVVPAGVVVVVLVVVDG